MKICHSFYFFILTQR